MTDTTTPPKAAIPNLSLVNGTRAEDIDASSVASRWISQLNDRLAAKDFSDLGELFHEEGWWRDFLTVSWDIRSLHGRTKISKYLTTSQSGLSNLSIITSGPLAPKLVNHGVVFLQTGFTFETKFGKGRGCLNLTNTAVDEWKAWVIHTKLEDLHKTNDNRHQTNGTSHSTNGTSYDHTVLIIGGGQSGVSTAARLQEKNIDYLTLDKFDNTGGAWKSRYDTVTAHTPSFADSYPFELYPKDYPLWPERNDIVKWMQTYAKKQNLNIRHNTTVTSIKRSNGIYHVAITDNHTGQTSILTCKHTVIAAGMFAGHLPRAPTFPSSSRFKDLIYHTSRHTTPPAMLPANLPITSARTAIIGTGTSAHDIAADWASHGAKSVTVIQRGPIFSMSRKATLDTFWTMYDPKFGNKVDDSDLLSGTMPSSVLRTVSIGMSQAMSAIDKEMLDGLEARGVRLKRGHDGVGFGDWLLIKYGSFYIDQGANQMIIDGKIKFRSCEDGVVDVDERGVVLDKEGKEVVEADVVVLATGFQRADAIVDELMADPEQRNKLGDIGSMDEEGERISWWRPSGLPGWWYMAGNFQWARSFSEVLVLQIEALENGLNPEYWEQ